MTHVKLIKDCRGAFTAMNAADKELVRRFINTFAPVGPYIKTAEDIGYVGAQHFVMSVKRYLKKFDNKGYQDATLRDLMNDVAWDLGMLVPIKC